VPGGYGGGRGGYLYSVIPNSDPVSHVRVEVLTVGSAMLSISPGIPGTQCFAL